MLYYHERNQHVDPGNCNICHKYNDSTVKRNIHIQRTHTYDPEKQQRTFECVTCGKVFRTRSNLSQHMRSHNKIGREKMNQVPHVLPCNYCKKLCKRRWNLKGHTILKQTKVALGPRAAWDGSLVRERVSGTCSRFTRKCGAGLRVSSVCSSWQNQSSCGQGLGLAGQTVGA